MSFETLSPWDALPYFRTPVQKVVTPPIPPSVLILPADPMRVAIVFAGDQSGSVFVGTDPNMIQLQGINVGNVINPLVLTHTDVGPLVQQAWYANGNGTVNLTIWEIVLTKWPRRRRNPASFEVPYAPPRPEKRFGSDNGNPDSWS